MTIIMVGKSQIFATSMSDLGILNCLVVMGYPQSLGSNQLMKWDVPFST